MGILRSLFAKRPAPTPGVGKNESTGDPRTNPNLIRVFDTYGRELFVSKEEWRTSVLPGAVRDAWNDPQRLYDVVVGALHDGFREDIVDAAKRLYETDTDTVRSACVWGIVLMEEGRLAEAEKILSGHGKRHGENGYVLTNLAKLYAKRGDEARTEATLWRALQLDPNQDNAVSWYMATHHERGGEPASLAGLKKLAALKGSWRAQLWLARAALAANDAPEALRLYRECLARTERPVPSDVLMQISGDLGNAGRLQDVVTIVAPEFAAATHGTAVGNNLLNAYVDLGQIEEAQRILDQLFALKRPDWQERLSYWDTAIAKARITRAATTKPDELKLALLVVEGPVWAKPESPAAELFPHKSEDSTIVSFLGSSADVATEPERIERQLADAPGRLSRAVPLFLAEQTSLGTRARTRTVIPWLHANDGFVLFRGRYKDADALQYATKDARTDYIVVSHIHARKDDWTLDVRLLRSSDGQLVTQLSETFPVAAPTESIMRMGRQVRELLCRSGGVSPQPTPPGYSVPAMSDFPDYLVRLEQLLAVRCASIDGARPGFLSGEREIVAGMIALCVHSPRSVSTRLLLAQTLLAMKRVRADVVAEFQERVTNLQRDHDLPPPAADIVQQLFNEAFSAGGVTE
jgi:tetratricopeptide (TPR) repeat protein